MLGGVSSGLACYFNLEANLIRILWVLLTLFTGFTLTPAYNKDLPSVRVNNTFEILMFFQRYEIHLHEVVEKRKLLSEGSNTAQKQPQRLKVFAKILQNIISAKNLQINCTLDENGEPILATLP